VFGINKYLLMGVGALVIIGLLFFGVKRWENSIRQEAIATERLKIKDELEKDYARKLPLTALLMMSLLSIFGPGCSQKERVITRNVMPIETPDPPNLSSMKSDRNDLTGELGLWMNHDDAKKEAEFRETIRSLKKSFTN
jgi:hypothetical protein